VAGFAQTTGFQAFRSGAWLTSERLRNYALILIAAYAVAIGALVATSHGGVDFMGRPVGTDFSNVWSAGRLALEGRPASAYDPAAQLAAQQAAFRRPDIPFYPWGYPPVFLLLAAALASLPYMVALLVWQAATLPAYLAVVRAMAGRREALMTALAFPPVFLTLTHGQNGFFTVGLIGGGLLLLDRRPLVAGLLLGLAAYKPQYGLLLPLALVVSGRWRTLAAAALTVLVLAGAAMLVFGPTVWTAFAHSATFTRTVVLEEGGARFNKLQSAFAAVRLWGGPTALAYAAQAVVGLAVAAAVAWLWRGSGDPRLKSAALLVGTLLATPYVLDYDLVLLGPAIALLVSTGLEKGFRPYEISICAFAFATPLVTRGLAEATLVPLGLIATLALFAAILSRARAERVAPVASASPGG
jgi:hypothetical protein